MLGSAVHGAADLLQITTLEAFFSTALYRVVDVDPTTLIGCVGVTVFALIGAVNIDPAVLNRDVRILGLSRYGTAQRDQHYGGGKREQFGS